MILRRTLGLNQLGRRGTSVAKCQNEWPADKCYGSLIW